MKVVNMILALIVLGLAGTSVFLASSLHTKRYQVIARGNDLSKTLENLVQKYDAIAKTEHSASVNIADMHHTKPIDKIQAALRAVTAQENDLLTYRDAIVDNVDAYGKELRLTPFYTVGGLKSADSMRTIAKNYPEGARKVRERNAREISSVTKIAGVLGVPAREDMFGDLSGSDTAFDPIHTAFSGMRNAVDDRYSELKTLQSGVVDLSRALTVPSGSTIKMRSDFDDNVRIGEELVAFEEAAAKLPADISHYESENETLAATIEERKEEIAERERGMVALNNQIAHVNTEITSFKSILSDPWPSPIPWTASDTTILWLAAEAQVSGVDVEQKFVTLDWGKNMKLKQPGTRNVVAAGFPSSGDAPMPGAQRLIIFRGDKTLICSVNVTRVHDDYAVANLNEIPVLYSDEEKEVRIYPEVGDKVIFLPTNFANIKGGTAVEAVIDEPIDDTDEEEETDDSADSETSESEEAEVEE